MNNDRLTGEIAHVIYFTKGEFDETTAGEMRPSDVRMVLARLAEYEDACFDENGNEIISVHHLHCMRGKKENEATLPVSAGEGAT
jgi:hypothetical protein